MFAISKENLMGKSKIGRKNRQKFKKQKQTEINKKDLKKLTKGPRLQNKTQISVLGSFARPQADGKLKKHEVHFIIS